MKFQDSSFNGLKVTVGTKSVTHPRTHAPTHAPKAICPINFFKVGGIMKELECLQDSPNYKSTGNFLDAQGQLTPQSLVQSGRNSNLFGI